MLARLEYACKLHSTTAEHMKQYLSFRCLWEMNLPVHICELLPNFPQYIVNSTLVFLLHKNCWFRLDISITRPILLASQTCIHNSFARNHHKFLPNHCPYSWE